MARRDAEGLQSLLERAGNMHAELNKQEGWPLSWLLALTFGLHIHIVDNINRFIL